MRNPKKSPPAFQFYTSDWAHSVSSMTLEERGAHISLLAWSWDHGPLPLDEERIALILGIDQKSTQFRRVWVSVSKRWRRDRKKGWVNLRLEEIRQKRSVFIKKQEANGRKGGRPRNPNLTQTKANREPKQKLSGLRSIDQDQDQDPLGTTHNQPDHDRERDPGTSTHNLRAEARLRGTH